MNKLPKHNDYLFIQEGLFIHESQTHAWNVERQETTSIAGAPLLATK